MNLLEKYNTLKASLKREQSDLDKSEGALQQLMSQLKDEFGCQSIKDAKKKHKALLAQQQELKEQAESLEAQTEEKWGEKITAARQ